MFRLSFQNADFIWDHKAGDSSSPKTQCKLEAQVVGLNTCALSLFCPPQASLLCRSGGRAEAPPLELLLCVTTGCSFAAPGLYQTLRCWSCTPSQTSLMQHRRWWWAWWWCGEDGQRIGPRVEGPLVMVWATGYNHPLVKPGNRHESISLEFPILILIAKNTKKTQTALI